MAAAWSLGEPDKTFLPDGKNRDVVTARVNREQQAVIAAQNDAALIAKASAVPRPPVGNVPFSVRLPLHARR